MALSNLTIAGIEKDLSPVSAFVTKHPYMSIVIGFAAGAVMGATGLLGLILRIL
jgi:hypothetical protein